MPAKIRISPYPNGKRFAFTIIDDTDGCTLETIRPVYDCLASLGFRTTKTVWALPPMEAPKDPRNHGDTLERGAHVEYLKTLRENGFEIALHNVSSGSSPRVRIVAGLDRFREVFGEDPKINVHHEKNAENIHFDWAQNPSILPGRFHGPLFGRLSARTRARAAGIGYSALHGQDPESEYFWGDICRERIRYVRTNLFFDDLNTLKCNPGIPYELPQTPYVNYWFDASNGQDADTFNGILSSGNIRRLKLERGCSILYTHFGKGFVDSSEGVETLNRETRERLQEIAGDPEGWYATVSEILDRLLRVGKVTSLGFEGGSVLSNRNPDPLDDVTLLAAPGAVYWDASGKPHAADVMGRIRFDSLPQGLTLLLERMPIEDNRYWLDRSRPVLLIDIATFRERLQARLRAESRKGGR